MAFRDPESKTERLDNVEGRTPQNEMSFKEFLPQRALEISFWPSWGPVIRLPSEFHELIQYPPEKLPFLFMPGFSPSQSNNLCLAQDKNFTRPQLSEDTYQNTWYFSLQKKPPNQQTKPKCFYQHFKRKQIKTLKCPDKNIWTLPPKTSTADQYQLQL